MGSEPDCSGQTSVQPAVVGREGLFARRLPRAVSALRHRNFRLYWFGQMISLVGTWMQNVAQGWLVYQLTNSPLALGLVGFSTALPVLLFSLFGGAMADRVSKRNLLVFTQSISAVQALTLAGLTATGTIQVWHVLVAAFVLGTVNAFDAPGRQSFVVEMVGKEDLMNAIALNSAVFNTARIVGPAMAGVLVSLPFVGIAGCFFLNGLSFLAVIAGLLLMRLPNGPRRESDGPIWQNLTAGLRYIRGDATVFTLVTLVGIASIFGMPYATLMPVFARDILEVDASGYGALMSAAGVGALMGAIGLAALGRYRPKGRLLTAGNLLFPATLLAFSLSRWYPLSLLILVAVGWSMVTQNATTNTLLQTAVPDHLRGRVMSVYILMFQGMMPFGSLQAGAVANAVGAPLALRLGAVIAAGYALLVFWRRPQVRQLP